MPLDSIREAFAKWMRGELNKAEADFHDDLQRVRVNHIHGILREFNALPEQPDELESEDGTYVAPASRRFLATPSPTTESSGENSPASPNSSFDSPVAPLRIINFPAIAPSVVVDVFSDAKTFLLKYGPLANCKYTSEFEETYETQESVKRKQYQGSDVSEMKMRLTEQIRQSLYYIAAVQVRSNEYHFFLEEKLIQLLDEFRKVINFSL